MTFTTKRLRASSRSSRAERRRSSLDSPPLDFDAGAHPILAKHWFNVPPFRPIGEVAAEVVADLRFRRQVNGQEAA